MTKEEFTKLFSYIEDFKKDVDKHFNEAAKDRREIKSSVAEIGGQLKDYHQELVMLAHKVDRLERWIQKVADKTGVKLEF